MDKPTPPKAMTETESAPGWPAGTKGCLLVTDAQIEAFGEAMAAWGAAQERRALERIATIAHEGGLERLDEYEALCEIRRLTLDYWKRT